MQLDKAIKLEKKREDSECLHENLSKEYHNGAATGDYVCTKCGKTGHGRDWNKSLLA